MAVTALIKVHSGKEMTAQDFAILVEKLTPDVSGILYGCTVSNSNSATLKISDGWCVVRGRIVQLLEGEIPVSVPSSGSSTKYVYLKVDLANTENTAEVIVGDSIPSDSSEFNILMSGAAYTRLASFTLGIGGISNIVNASKMSSVSPDIATKSITIKSTSDVIIRQGSVHTLYLKRIGNIVWCQAFLSCELRASFASGVDLYDTATNSQLVIPTGYRPGSSEIRMYAVNSSGGTMKSTTTAYVIRPSASGSTPAYGVNLFSSDREGRERICETCWITTDNWPAS